MNEQESEIFVTLFLVVVGIAVVVTFWKYFVMGLVEDFREYSAEQERKQLDKERRKAAKKARREELKRLREYSRD